MRNALIIFVRKPEWGKVKTRLAASIGNDKTLAIYNLLLQKTKQVVDAVYADKFVFYVDSIAENDLWNDYYKLVQPAGDLGIKMKRAFNFVFNLGYEKACIIGSDCYDLTHSAINNCYTLLQQQDVVIGPANDGGYYLLGQKQNNECLFSQIEWSTVSVLETTTQLCVAHNLHYALLNELTDIDTIQDLQQCETLYQQYLAME